MRGLQEAITVRAPHGNGTTDKRRVYTVAVGAASTAEQETTVSAPGVGEWVTFVADTDCFVRFGVTGVGAATSSDWPMLSGVPQAFFIEPNEDRFFRAIRSTADGTLKWYISG
jgi:hypothetical protein